MQRFVSGEDGTRVVNVRVEPCDVRIDRTTRWGNPFRIGADGSRQQVVRRYAEWITRGEGRHLLAHLEELRGKRVGCWCEPEQCHGEVLVWLLGRTPKAGPAQVVAVTGSRDWTDAEAVEQALTRLPAGTRLVVGDARGADAIAQQVARKLGMPVQVFRADWQAEGRQAGMRRNERMLREGGPVLVLAFPLQDSRGTRHMIRIARQAGVRVLVHGERQEPQEPIARCIRCEDAKPRRQGRRNIDLWARGSSQKEAPVGGETCRACSRRKDRAARVVIVPQAITWVSCRDCGAPLDQEGRCFRCEAARARAEARTAEMVAAAGLAGATA